MSAQLAMPVQPIMSGRMRHLPSYPLPRREVTSDAACSRTNPVRRAIPIAHMRRYMRGGRGGLSC